MDGNSYADLDEERRVHHENEIEIRLGIQEDLRLFYIRTSKVKGLLITRLIDSPNLKKASCGYFFAGEKEVRGNYTVKNEVRDEKRDLARRLSTNALKALGDDRHMIINEIGMFTPENYRHQGFTAFYWTNGTSNGHSLQHDPSMRQKVRIIENKKLRERVAAKTGKIKNRSKK